MGMNLNIVGIRGADKTPNKFNDVLTVFWKYEGRWSFVQFKCTTEAGIYWLEHPMKLSGTAILKCGQYKSSWKIGKHKGKYTALVQSKPITVIRDADKDREYDYNSGNEEEGLFGINIHRSNPKRESTQVGKWSAGCQVFANPWEFDVFIKICEEAADVYSNSFTYTLINESDLYTL
jgi:hypothetical protein